MIDKVIIAEDHESANLSVQKTIEDMRIKKFDYVYYCDDAFQKIETASRKGEPYDLLITDLYFEEDGNHQKIGGGFDLIQSVRAFQPDIRILIFSSESRPATIDMLFKKYEIDGYVRKARNDARELKTALETLSKNQVYYPPTLAQLIKKTNAQEFTEFDINIIRLLAQGYQQNQIPDYLKKHNIKPCSLSIIEKRLKQLRDDQNYTKNEQLVLYCKNIGLL